MRHAASSLNRASIFTRFIALRKCYCAWIKCIRTRSSHWVRKGKEGHQLCTDFIVLFAYVHTSARFIWVFPFKPFEILFIFMVSRRESMSRSETHRDKRHVDITRKQTTRLWIAIITTFEVSRLELSFEVSRRNAFVKNKITERYIGSLGPRDR